MENDYSPESLSALYCNEGSNWLEEMAALQGKQHPSVFTIQKILGYSKALNCQKSREFGVIEYLMN